MEPSSRARLPAYSCKESGFRLRRSQGSKENCEPIIRFHAEPVNGFAILAIANRDNDISNEVFLRLFRRRQRMAVCLLPREFHMIALQPQRRQYPIWCFACPADAPEQRQPRRRRIRHEILSTVPFEIGWDSTRP